MLRCNSVGVNLVKYRLVDTIVGWPQQRVCAACARPELSAREMRRENDTPRARLKQRGFREDKRMRAHHQRVMRHLTKKRAIKRAWLDTEDDE
jgi:hypothetical protein